MLFSHWMLGVFRPLKLAWKGILKRWFTDSRLQKVSKEVFPCNFMTSYQKKMQQVDLEVADYIHRTKMQLDIGLFHLSNQWKSVKGQKFQLQTWRQKHLLLCFWVNLVFQRLCTLKHPLNRHLKYYNKQF